MVSVLLTCYNHKRYLPAAYQSVLDQTFEDYEILAIDDGSTDGTREWLREQDDRRLRCIFNEQNLGTYASLNVGLGEAKGDYIAIFNDDDVWAPVKLAEQIALFESNPRLGLVHTSGWFIDQDGDRHPDAAPMGFPFPQPPNGDILTNLVERNQIITSSVLVKREAFDQCGVFDPAYYGCGDWNLWLRIAAKYEIAQVDQPLTYYRIHGSNAAWNSRKMLEDDVRVREWLASWPVLDERLKDDPSVQKALAHNWACLGTEYASLGDPSKGRAAYAKSIRMLPTRLKSYARWVSTFLPARGAP